MGKTWYMPSGTSKGLFEDALSQPHLLVAGATGSGKSVTINGMIATALYRSPCDTPNDAQFILIDPKMVSLAKYKNLPHTVAYADTHDSICEAMELAKNIMYKRYSIMQQRGIEEWDGGHLYIFIDELMDLMTTPSTKKRFAPVLQCLCQLGRASRVCCVICTQCPLKAVIDTPIKCNIDARICLRTENAQDSRNIMRRKGAELLPSPRTAGCAYAYYKRGPEIDLVKIPMIEKEEIQRLIKWWIDQK